MSGSGSSGGGSSPANTTAVNTVVQDLPTWEQQYMTNLLGQATSVAANPYQQFPGQQVAGFTPDQTQAFSNVENLVNNNTAGNIQNSGVNSALAGANSAQNIYSAGSPYLQGAAAQGSAQGVNSYMSPFLSQELQGLQTSAQQNWNNSTAPSINDAFIGAGQFGSGRNAQVIGQQASLADQALTGQLANAANSAYNTAGGLAQNQAGILANVGNSLGNLANTQAGTQANVGTQLGALGNQVQNTAITGNAALQGVGQQQQSLNQQNIDTAMTNFQNQVQYPQQQLSWLSNILHGLPSTSATTGTSTSPMTNSVVGSVSPLSSLGGALIGTAGLGSTGSSTGTSGGLKAGGLIKAMARGGAVKAFAGGGQASSDELEYFMNPDSQVSAHDLNPATSYDTSSFVPPPPPPSGIAIDGNAPLDSMVPVDLPAGSSAPSSPLPSPATTQMSSGEKAPTTSQNASVDGYKSADNSNPLSGLKVPQPMSEEQQRGYQLLAMAKGLLTPAHSGAEALGNALGNYGQVGQDQAKWNAEMQAKYIPMQIDAQRAAEEARYHTGELSNSAQSRILEGKRLEQEAKNQSAERAIQQQVADQGRYQPVKDVYGNITGIINGKTGEVRPIASLNPSAATSGADVTSEPPSADPQKAAIQILNESGTPPTQVMTRQDISGRNQQSKAYNDAQLAAKSAIQQLDSLGAESGKYTSGGGMGKLYGAEQYFGMGGEGATARAEAEKASKNLANAFMQANVGAKGAGIKMVQFDAGAVPNPDMTDDARKDLISKQKAIANSQIQRAVISNTYPRMHMNDVNAIMDAYEEKNPPVLSNGSANPSWMPYKDWLAAGRPNTAALATQKESPRAGQANSTQSGIPESVPKPLENIKDQLHYSAKRKQYKDNAGNIYDETGNKVQ